MEVPRLHPDTIEEVKQRVDIVDVVSEHVVLRKRGKDYTGLCPFHDDKSPSFSVSPSKQFYYCFSCGAGGNAIKFLMEIGKHSFADVVLDLAKRYQVPIKTLEPAQRQELQRQLSLREQLYEVLALTAKFYEHALHQTDGKLALDYLQAKRGLQPETIQQFQLGYAPGGWQTLYGYLVEQKQYPVELVEKAGLIVPRQEGRGYYDRFRDRLMIPIHDLQGRVIGFGGRTLGEEQPKYLNSPETELFDKGKTLFALDKARATIAKQDRAVVVEGYFDVIALHAAGVTNAVASLGTALSVVQVRQLLRYTDSKQVIYNFDADTAGAQATIRAIDEIYVYLSRGDDSLKAERILATKEAVSGAQAASAHMTSIDLRILNIPSGKDPDEFLKSHSSEEYQALLDQAVPWLDWKIQRVFKGKDLKQSEHFQSCVEEIVQLLGGITDATIRTYYVRRCAEQLSAGDPRLAIRLEDTLRTQVRGQRWHGRSQKWQRPGDRSLLEESEAQLLQLYLHVPEYRQLIQDSLEERDLDFSLAHHRLLWQLILEIEKIASTRTDLIQQLQDRCVEAADRFGWVQPLFQLNEKSQRDLLRAPLVVRTAIASMERVMCEKRRRHFLDLWKQTDYAVAPELAQYYQQQIYAETQRIEEIDRDQRQVSFSDLAQMPWVGEFQGSLSE